MKPLRRTPSGHFLAKQITYSESAKRVLYPISFTLLKNAPVKSDYPYVLMKWKYRVSTKKVNEFGEEYLNNEPSELAQIWNLDSGDPVHQNDHGSFFH